MKLLIFEPDHGGHRLVYVQHLLESIAGLGIETVLVTSPHAPASVEYKTALDAARLDQVDASAHVASTSPLRNAASRLKQLRVAVRKHRPDRVMIPYGDGLIPVQALTSRKLPGRCTAESIVHHTRFSYPQPRGLRGKALALNQSLIRRSGVQRLLFVDHMEYAWAAQRCETFHPQIDLLPDPVPIPDDRSKEEARELLGIDPDGLYIGCVGQMSTRKGIDHLIHAYASSSLKSNTRLLLVGKQDENVRSLCRDHQELVDSGAIVSRDAFVEMDTLNLALQAMDFVVVASPGHVGISSVVLRAVAAKRPVLGASSGWMGWIIPTLGLGETTDPTDSASLTQAVENMCDHIACWRPSQAALKLRQFHDLDNFHAVISNRIREKLGRPHLPEVRWDSVIGDQTAVP